MREFIVIRESRCETEQTWAEQQHPQTLSVGIPTPISRDVSAESRSGPESDPDLSTRERAGAGERGLCTVHRGLGRTTERSYRGIPEPGRRPNGLGSQFGDVSKSCLKTNAQNPSWVLCSLRVFELLDAELTSPLHTGSIIYVAHHPTDSSHPSEPHSEPQQSLGHSS